MGICDLKAALRDDVCASVGTPRFDAARQRHHALAPHASLFSVLGLLTDRSARRDLEKEALVRALIAEQQQHGDPLWSTALLLAFRPLLARLRGRIRCDDVAAGELDQMVIVTFLEVVAQLPVGDERPWTLRRLRRTTERRLFSQVRRHRRIAARTKLLAPADLDAMCDGAPWGADGSAVTDVWDVRGDETADLVAFLAHHAGDILDDEGIERVIATQVHGEDLREYLTRRHPELAPQALERLYQSVKRRHSRVLARLRIQLFSRRVSPIRVLGRPCVSRGPK
jgi:hypothetical protein